MEEKEEDTEKGEQRNNSSHNSSHNNSNNRNKQQYSFLVQSTNLYSHSILVCILRYFLPFLLLPYSFLKKMMEIDPVSVGPGVSSFLLVPH